MIDLGSRDEARWAGAEASVAADPVPSAVPHPAPGPAGGFAGPVDPEQVAGSCRLVFVLMIASASLTVAVGSFDDRYGQWPAALVIGQATVCFVALRWWRRAGPLLSAHPVVLFVFLSGTVASLVAVGPSGPFTFVLLAVCMLAGLLYDWRGRVLFPVVGTAGWLGAASGHAMSSPRLVVFGFPVLIALATAVGVGQRRLLDRQAAMELRLRAASRAAALADERARMARDMHDSVIKTLYGVSLQAQAIVRWARRDPDAVATTAKEITREVSDVAAKVRELVGELRSTSEQAPATRLVADLCHRWSSAARIPVSVEVDDRCVLAPDAAAETCMVLGEALENVRRHAGAQAVAVSLLARGETVELHVDDDGRGIPEQLLSVAAAAAGGRYGLVGMRERAIRLGGSLDVRRGPGGRGTRVRLRFPVPHPHPWPAGREGGSDDEFGKAGNE